MAHKITGSAGIQLVTLLTFNKSKRSRYMFQLKPFTAILLIAVSFFGLLQPGSCSR